MYRDGPPLAEPEPVTFCCKSAAYAAKGAPASGRIGEAVACKFPANSGGQAQALFQAYLASTPSTCRISTAGGWVSTSLKECIQLPVSLLDPMPLLRNWSS